MNLLQAKKTSACRFNKFTGCVTFVLLLLPGCAIFPRLPPANLNEPGWKVLNGQAVWHVAGGRTEIAGDVTVATRPDGEAFVQFSKNPFPVVVGRANENRWSVDFPSERKHYAGPGSPPKRIIWLHLPRVLNGAPPPAGWSWRRDDTGWRLENRKAQESIEGYFDKK